MSIKDFILSLVPNTWLSRDSYQDSNGQGFVHRFLNSVGDTLDLEVVAKIEEAMDLKNPLLVEPRYLTLLSNHLGVFEEMTLTEYTHRQMLQQIPSIMRIRGTVQSYKDMYFFLGFSGVSIIETEPPTLKYDIGSKYDTGLKYDTRNNNSPISYTIELLGLGAITLEKFARMENIRRFLEPINANFAGYQYNGGDIGDLAVTVEIINGDLYYNNDADPTLVLSLDSEGNLLVSGPNSSRYYLDSGDLYFITNT